jgi:hypothetical protein
VNVKRGWRVLTQHAGAAGVKVFLQGAALKDLLGGVKRLYFEALLQGPLGLLLVGELHHALLVKVVK